MTNCDELEVVYDVDGCASFFSRICVDVDNSTLPSLHGEHRALLYPLIDGIRAKTRRNRDHVHDFVHDHRHQYYYCGSG